MNAVNDPLWQALEAFELDQPGAALTFSQRLARENGWSHSFAQRVVQEYKKFLWLAVRAGHPVTPSDEVDQAWHLHLVYTDSYWNDLCGKTLGRPLHHGPTRGGGAENTKYREWYGQTKESYARRFGAEPRSDIWPPDAMRFNPRVRFQRVDMSSVWMLPKAPWQHRARVAALVLGAILVSGLMLASCTGQDGMNPLWILLGFGVIVTVGAIARSRSHRDKKRKDNSSGCSSASCSSGCGSSGSSRDSGCGSSDGGSGCGGGGCGGGD
jgi:hypothetical protein